MKINAAVNFYFMFASAFMIVVVRTWITEKIVEPRLKKYGGNAESISVDEMSTLEKKGLRWAGVSLLLVVIALAFTIIPDNGIFRNLEI